MVEQHTIVRQSIKIWCMVDARFVGADGFGSMVICHDEDDVRLAGRHGCLIVRARGTMASMIVDGLNERVASLLNIF